MRIAKVLVLLVACSSSTTLEPAQPLSSMRHSFQPAQDCSSQLLSPSSSPPPPGDVNSEPQRDLRQDRKRLRASVEHSTHAQTSSSFSGDSRCSRSPSPDRAFAVATQAQPQVDGGQSPAPATEQADRLALAQRRVLASIDMLASAHHQLEGLADFVAGNLAGTQVPRTRPPDRASRRRRTRRNPAGVRGAAAGAGKLRAGV